MTQNVLLQKSSPVLAPPLKEVQNLEKYSTRKKTFFTNKNEDKFFIFYIFHRNAWVLGQFEPFESRQLVFKT